MPSESIRISSARHSADAAPAVLRIARQLHLEPIMWSVTGYDWDAPLAEIIERKVTRQIRGGDVILLARRRPSPNGSGPLSKPCSQTDRLIDRYKTEGYEFVTIPENDAEQIRPAQTVSPKGRSPPGSGFRLSPRRQNPCFAAVTVCLTSSSLWRPHSRRQPHIVKVADKFRCQALPGRIARTAAVSDFEAESQSVTGPGCEEPRKHRPYAIVADGHSGVFRRRGHAFHQFLPLSFLQAGINLILVIAQMLYGRKARCHGQRISPIEFPPDTSVPKAPPRPHDFRRAAIGLPPAILRR